VLGKAVSVSEDSVISIAYWVGPTFKGEEFGLSSKGWGD
jgi:hypothetical protein